MCHAIQWRNDYLRKRDKKCWRIFCSLQSLHVCVDGKVWKWCQPFTIDEPGHVIRVVKTLDQHYSLIVYIKNVSNVQKQVIFQILDIQIVKVLDRLLI